MSDISVYQHLPIGQCAGLTIDDTCSYVGVRRSTIYNLINEKKIQAIKVRGRTIVLRQTVDDYLNSLVETKESA